MRRLLPEPGPASVEEAIGALDLVALAGDERPYVVTNFVLSLDGRATLGGRSGPLGSELDARMLMALRARVDAVMIGAGTMRAERYGRIVPSQERRERREREGLAHDPLAVLVSGRLDLPWDAPLFSEQGQVLIFTSSEAEPPPTTASVRVERHPGAVDLRRALAALRHERGVRALLCEGGPTLHAQLIEAGLVDELFVTHAPKLVGGEGPRLVGGLSERERLLELAWLLHEEETGELFARYRALAEPD